MMSDIILLFINIWLMGKQCKEEHNKTQNFLIDFLASENVSSDSQKICSVSESKNSIYRITQWIFFS